MGGRKDEGSGGGSILSLMNITLVQRTPVLGDKEANLKIMEKEVNRAAKKGTDLVVFGELFLTGYSIKDKVARLAEPKDGPSIKRLAKLARAKGCHILFGMPERGAKVRGLIYNSAVLVGPDKDVNIYRKWFLPTFGPFEEKLHYTPGNNIEIFDIKVGRLGVLICYDIFFPELAKTYAMMGADLLVVLSAAPLSSKPFFELLTRARAVENAIPLAYCNLVGSEQGLKFFGGSRIVGAKGNVRVQGKLHEVQVMSGQIDHKETDLARFHRATIRDTRKEVFDLLEASF